MLTQVKCNFFSRIFYFAMSKSRNFRDYKNRLSSKSRLRKLVCIYQIEPYVTPKASIAPNLLICNRLQWNLLFFAISPVQ